MSRVYVTADASGNVKNESFRGAVSHCWVVLRCRCCCCCCKRVSCPIIRSYMPDSVGNVLWVVSYATHERLCAMIPTLKWRDQDMTKRLIEVNVLRGGGLMISGWWCAALSSVFAQQRTQTQSEQRVAFGLPDFPSGRLYVWITCVTWCVCVCVAAQVWFLFGQILWPQIKEIILYGGEETTWLKCFDGFSLNGLCVWATPYTQGRCAIVV